MSPDGARNHSKAEPNGAQNADNGVSAGQDGVSGPIDRLVELIAASPHNLVARSDRSTLVERHIRECLALADVLTPSGRWMDLGTGGGLPGLVLAIRHPQVEWVLVDATAKKVEAVAAFAIALGLDNVVAVHGRAETLGQERAHRGRYDGVTSRAVGELTVLAELARGFLRASAPLVAMKGPRWRDEVERAAAALRTLGYSAVHSQQLPVPGRESWVVTMQAQGPPPAGYPRRDGIPKQQPLA